MKKPIYLYLSLFLLLLGLGRELQAQPDPTTIFRFETISVVPANPTPTEQIAITLAGFKLDSCVYLESSSYTVGVNTVDFFFGFQNDPPPENVTCGPALVPFDTTIIVGPLPPAVYTINTEGPLTSSAVPPQQRFFVVSPTDCFDANGDIWVTTDQDDGAGSLREAIDCANSTAGPNRIRFHIPNLTARKIRVGFSTDLPLPPLTDPGTIIDGTTQPGFGDNGDRSPKIILDGAFENWDFPISALRIEGDNCQVLALEIINFPNDGIDVLNADNVAIGLPNAGNYIHSNGSETDFFPNAPVGSGPWEGSGIVVRGNSIGCQILGNVIGTNGSNDPGLGNEWSGISVRDNANSCNIGGPDPGQANVIAGNPIGVQVDGVNNCLIQHNAFFCNDIKGIELLDGANNGIERPTILTANPTEISGTAFGISTSVEIYINDLTPCFGTPCQGRTYLGTATIVNDNWTLTPPFANGIALQGGERLTALAEDGVETSEFSECQVSLGVSACTQADGSIVVTNILDEGPGSLRAAIECANSTAGGNLIRFSIPGPGPHTIFVGQTSNEALPDLTDPGTIIDGTTQSGLGGNGPRIILDGQIPVWQVPINALFIRADFCEVYGLQIINFPDDAIDLLSASYCRIGAPGRGNVIYNNGLEQDFFPGAPNSGPWNGCGIVVRSDALRNEIKGNAIGTDFSGSIIAGNEYCGILIRTASNNNVVGGSGAGEGNLIAGNEQGIRVQGTSRANSFVQNELFCNSVAGIQLEGSGANDGLAAPTITTSVVDTIRGTATIQEGTVEVFVSDTTGCATAPCQGKTYLGTATIDAGEWELTVPYAGGVLLNGLEDLTALTTDTDGNSSPFADCAQVDFPCSLEATIVDQLDATCGLANGFTTVSATGGIDPFQYDIGTGPNTSPTLNNLVAGDYFITVTDGLGCTVVVETTIGDSPVPTINVVNLTDATCLEANGSLSVLADNGTGSFDYDIGNGPQGDTLFENLAAGSYTVTAMDALGCTASIAATIDNQGQAPLASFTYQTNDATVSFNNTSIEGATFFWDFGDGNSATTENPTHVYALDGDNTVCMTTSNSCGMDQFCTLVSVVLPLADFSISGLVAMEDGTPVVDVELSCTGASPQTTPAGGNYTFGPLPAGGDYTLTASKNTLARNGISILDLVLIQRHLLFLDSLDSPYQIIAADVTNNQQLSPSDLVIIQRIILLDIDAFPNSESWRFVPAAHVFPNPLNPFTDPYPEAIQIDGLSMDMTDQDFVAIKVGDVSGNANPLLFGAGEPLELWTTEQSLQTGSVLEVHLTSADFAGLAAWQSEFYFDPVRLALSDWEASPALDLQLGTRHLDAGRLPLLWWDQAARADGVDVAPEEVLLTLRFEVLRGGVPLSEAFGLAAPAARNEVLTSEDRARPIALRFDRSTALLPASVATFELGQNRPNPFGEYSWIPFVLPRSGSAELRIYDLTGRLVYQTRDQFGAGAQQWRIRRDVLAADGLYFYELRYEDQTRIRRMIVD